MHILLLKILILYKSKMEYNFLKIVHNVLLTTVDN
jgi:hypothetical protein